MKFFPFVGIFDPMSFYPLSFDPKAFDPNAFDPMSVNPGFRSRQTQLKTQLMCFTVNIKVGKVHTSGVVQPMDRIKMINESHNALSIGKQTQLPHIVL